MKKLALVLLLICLLASPAQAHVGFLFGYALGSMGGSGPAQGASPFILYEASLEELKKTPPLGVKIKVIDFCRNLSGTIGDYSTGVALRIVLVPETGSRCGALWYFYK